LAVHTRDQVFNQELIVVLTANGIVVSDTGDYRLHVLSLERENKEITLSGGGIVSDYELTGTLKWGLETTNGLALFSPREIRMSRIYQYTYNHATASRSEEDLIWGELTQALLISLMRQVSAFSSQELATLTADARAAAEVVQQ
jgi:outer membrane lipopolysaccharide assembly protein LptE/RlpB